MVVRNKIWDEIKEADVFSRCAMRYASVQRKIQFAYITLDDSVAVNIDRLVIFREHLRDEHPEIRGFGVVIPEGQFIGDGQ